MAIFSFYETTPKYSKQFKQMCFPGWKMLSFINNHPIQKMLLSPWEGLCCFIVLFGTS